MKKIFILRLCAVIALSTFVSCDAVIPQSGVFGIKAWGVPEKISKENFLYQYLNTSADDYGNIIVSSKNFVKRYISGAGWYVDEYEDIIGHAPLIFNAPCIRQNASGDAVIVWYYTESVPSANLFSNYFIRGTTWHDYGLAPHAFTSDHVDRFSNRQARDLCINENGEAIAVWIGYAGSGPDYVNTGFLDIATGDWSNETIAGSSGSILCVNAVFISSDEAIAVWLLNHSDPSIAYSIYSSGSWSDAVIDDLGIDNVSNITFLKVDKNGNCVFVFNSSDTIFMRQFSKATHTWGPVEEILTAPTNSIEKISFDMNKDGRGMLCWRQLKNQLVDPNDVFARAFSISSGWKKIEAVDKTVFPCWFPAVAVSPDGNAMAFWIQEGSTENYYYAAFYNNFSGWELPVKISHQNEYTPGYRNVIQADSQNRYTAVWIREDNTASELGIWACRYE